MIFPFPACIYLPFNHIVSYLLYNVIGIPCGIFLGGGRNRLKLTRYKYKYIGVCSCGCHGLVAKLCPMLWDPTDYSPPGSSVHGIFQARILEWVAISFTKGSSWSRDWILVSCIASKFFTADLPGKPMYLFINILFK